MEAVTDFLSFGSKITTDSDCSHEIKKHLILEKKPMTNLDSVYSYVKFKNKIKFKKNKIKSREITLLTKVCLVKAVVFPVVMYRCESSAIKKAEH